MTFLGRGLVTLFGLAMTLVLCQAEEPKPVSPAKADEATKQAAENVAFDMSRYSKLTASDFTEPDPDVFTERLTTRGVYMDIVLSRDTADYADVIRVVYSISFEEHQKNFVIARPSLEIHKGAKDETKLFFFIRGKSGKMYEFNYHNIAADATIVPIWAWEYHYRKDFSKVPSGNHSADGVFVIQTSDVKRCLIASKPQEFLGLESPTIHVRLEYNATDDGERYGYKAWTGKLVSDNRHEKLKGW